jgi:hypothetical protein
MLENWRCVYCGADTGGTISSTCAVCLQTQKLSRLMERQSNLIERQSGPGYIGGGGGGGGEPFDPKNPWHWIRDFFRLLLLIPLFGVALVVAIFFLNIAVSLIKAFFG